MEKTEDGKRFKQSYRAGFHTDLREKVVIETLIKTAAIRIPDPPPLRYNGSVFSMRSASFKYPGTKEKLVDNFSIDIELGSRTVLLGSNGSGKTTLLNLLVGRLSPTSGEVYRHPLLRVGYFSQHVVDELDENDTPVDALMKMQSAKNEQEVRQHLGTVGMSGPVALRQIKYLSGGQRNRVALAIILFQSPHVLILDEITNHLDMGTVEALVDALAGYPGAIVAVSHDVWFLKQLMEEQHTDDHEEEVPAEEDPSFNTAYYLVQRGKPIARWEKGIDDYVAKVLKTVRRR